MSEVDAKTKGEFANWVLPQATGHLMEEIETLRSKLSASEEAREQAQIERDNWQADYRTMYGNRDYWKVRAKDAEERAEKAEAALRKIASCETYVDGDIVSVARAALKEQE